MGKFTELLKKHKKALGPGSIELEELAYLNKGKAFKVTFNPFTAHDQDVCFGGFQTDTTKPQPMRSHLKLVIRKAMDEDGEMLFGKMDESEVFRIIGPLLLLRISGAITAHGLGGVAGPGELLEAETETLKMHWWKDQSALKEAGL